MKSRMAYFKAADEKISRSKVNFAPTCKEIAKEMPAKSFEIDSNPQKVGSAAEAL